MSRDIDLVSEWLSKYNRMRAGSVLASGRVLAPGMVGSLAAGRELTVKDFTDRGLVAPKALFNFNGNGNDSSGNGHHLTNAGAVTYDKGITGVSGTAARFTGAATSYFTGPNALKMPYGSFGFWFKTNQGHDGTILSFQTATSLGIRIMGSSSTAGFGKVHAILGTTADLANFWNSIHFVTKATTDGRWHFATVTWDGTRLIHFIDGKVDALEGGLQAGGSGGGRGPMYEHASQVMTVGVISTSNLSGYWKGWIDEMFFTEQVLTLEQHRWLYAAKVPHTSVVAPNNVDMLIERYAPNGLFSASDFPTQPLVGYNFDGVSFTADDYGSLGKVLTATGTIRSAPGVDGKKESAAYFDATSFLAAANDTGLPGGTSARTIGAWVKKVDQPAAFGCIMSYGTRMAMFFGSSVAPGGRLHPDFGDGGLDVGDYYDDGRWHFFVVTFDNSAVDGVRGRAYADGEIVRSATASDDVALGVPLRIGSDGTLHLATGFISTAFVCGYALTAEEMLSLYLKTGGALIDKGPIDPGPFVEAVTDAAVYLICDELDGRSIVKVLAR